MSKVIQQLPAVLLLADGSVFKGYAIGKTGTTTGEICFNTSMTGYQEIFTDPSYYKQILVSTNVHVGNYGIAHSEIESDSIKIAGLVCRSFNIPYARKLADTNIQDYFADNHLVGISGVDTRSLVTYIRNKGAMNAIISSEETDVNKLMEQLKSVPDMNGLELSSMVTTQKPYFEGDENAPIRIALLDLGVKKNIIRSLTQRGCYVGVFPAKTSFEEMMNFKPNGFQISNGPGDPSAMPYAVDTVKQILNADIPLFGICLGHQILAEAAGIKTFKMFNGHRGGNHPVKNLETGKCEVTSQNHGFSVRAEDVESNPNIKVTHINLNDQTIEGIRLLDKKAFSVQYHPEANPGPHDSRYLFDNFMQMIQS